MKILNKVKCLSHILNNSNYFYYVKNTPYLLDKEYDYLMQKLINIEKKYPELIINNSPTQKIGYELLNNKNLPILYHFTSMLSLDNVFDKKNFLLFYKKIQKKLNTKKILFCCELKLDGLAVNLIYKNGYLEYAATRGNGKCGEDITKNIKKIKSIPLKLVGNLKPNIIEVRGEVFMKKSIFSKLNNMLSVKKKKIFSNPRNAAIGSLKQSNAQITADRSLSFFCYSIGIMKGLKKTNSQLQDLKLLKKLGLPIEKHSNLCSSSKEVLNFYSKINKIKSTFNFNIDGIVIKIDNKKLQNKLGNNHKSPKWAIAFKFYGEEKITKIQDIKFQVGRTGRITPVAVLQPIRIGGTIIKKVTLHNLNEFNRLKLSINDKIVVHRSGDVIPQIIKVLNKLNNKEKINFPDKCPSCHSFIEKEKNKKYAYCTGGLKCQKQKSALIIHFISKKAINIPNIGKKTIMYLVTGNYINNPVDLFFLTTDILKNIKFIGKKLSIKIINSLNNSKKTTLSRFIYSLGIPQVGISAAENLSKHFIKLENIIHANTSELNKVTNIGHVVSKKIRLFMKNKKNIDLIYKLVNNVGISWDKIV